MTTIAQALAWARQQGLDRVDAHLLMAHLLQADRAWLLAHDGDTLDETAQGRFQAWVAERAQGVPVAYLLGEKEFHGLSLRVSPAVLVPRPDTEVLVDWALELLAGQPHTRPAPRVVDLGTGSGAIALAVKHRAPQAEVQMVDLSPDALAVASGNAQRLALAVTARQGSWWEPLAGQKFDLVLSNPPYIAGGDPHLPALRHEPTLALTPGGDGLSALQTIIDGAPAHMAPGAWLLLEHGYDQAAPVRAMLARAGFESLACREDLGGQPRTSGGRKPV